MAEELTQAADEAAAVDTRSSLGRWYDGELALPKNLAVHLIVEEEISRLAKLISIVVYASSIPRRLGGEASSDDLASDKRRCRRVAHALQQAYRCWTKKAGKLPDGEEIRIAGAQLLWKDFLGRENALLSERSKIAATFAVQSNDPDIIRWGKTAIVNYDNERRWVEYALRD